VGLSGKERDRLVVLRQVKEGKLSQRKAAEQLGLSSRWVKKLMKRLRKEGDRGLAHGLRGRRSNRGHGEQIRKRPRNWWPSTIPTMGRPWPGKCWSATTR
jgi:biotin operon repressor